MPHYPETAQKILDYIHQLCASEHPDLGKPDVSPLSRDERRKLDEIVATLTQLRSGLEDLKAGHYHSELAPGEYLVNLTRALQLDLGRASELIRTLRKNLGLEPEQEPEPGQISQALQDVVTSQASQSKDEVIDLLLSRTVQKIMDAEERWRLALECSRDGVFDLSPSGETPFISGSLINMQGWPRERTIPKELASLDAWISLIHPDDIRALDLFKEIRDDSFPKDAYDVTFRFKTFEGAYAWRRCRGQISRTPEGRIHRTVGVLEDIHARKEQQDKYIYRATHDPLTGLPNRELFHERLEQMLERQGGDEEINLLVVLADLDYFKQVNDTMGHQTGDVLLKEFAKRLRSTIREGDIAARLGGDEFGMLLVCGTDPAGHAAAISRIRSAVAETLSLGGKPYTISSSMGVAVAPRDGTEPALLVKRADEALYHVKRGGRNGVHFFSPAPQ